MPDNQDAAMGRLAVVDLDQYIADQKGFGAMEAALEEIAKDDVTRDRKMMARHALAMVAKFRKEAGEVET